MCGLFGFSNYGDPIKNISDLVKSLWNNMLNIGEESQQPTIPSWD